MGKRQTAIRLQQEQAARIANAFGTLSGGATEIIEKTEEAMKELGLSLDELIEAARENEKAVCSAVYWLENDMAKEELQKAYNQAGELTKKDPDMFYSYLAGKGLTPPGDLDRIERRALLRIASGK